MAVSKKFLEYRAVGSKQFQLENDLSLNATSSAGQEEALLKYDSSNVLQILKLPRVQSAPAHENDLTRKSYVDGEIISLRDLLRYETSAVESRLIAEELRAKAEEARIEGRLEDEEDRALAAEAALGIRIDGEIFRAMQKEAEIEASVATKIPLAYIGAASGVAPLGSDSKIPAQYLPAVAITDTFVVTTLEQRDALVPASVQTGDIVKVVEAITSSDGTKLPRTYIYDGSQFIELTTESDVDSVNGFVGHITLDTSHIAEQGDYRYYTAAREAELLKRDGSATITGALMPDQDGIRELGNLSYRFSSVLTKEVRASTTEALKLDGFAARLEASGQLSLELDQNAMGYAVQLKSGSDTALKMGQSGISLTRQGKGLTAEDSKVELVHTPFRKLSIGDSASLEIDSFKQLYINDEVSRLMQGYSRLDLKSMGDSYLAAPSGVVVSTAQEGFNSAAPTLVLGGSEGGMSGAKLRNGSGEFSLDGAEAKMSFSAMGVGASLKVKQEGMKFAASPGGYFDMSSLQIKNLLDPTDAQDAVTKSYLESAVQGGVNGLLDSNNKLKVEYVPAIAITDVYVVQNIAARDALMVEEGDVAKVIEAELAADGMTWLPRTYIYAVDNQSQIGSWIEISAESDVMSVAGKIGHVTLDTGDVAEKSGGPLYFTDARAKAAAVVDSIMGDEHDMAPSVHAAKSYIDSELDSLIVPVQQFREITLTALDVSNGYIDIDVAMVGTPWVMRQGLMGRPGLDFLHTPTRISFTNEWVSPGISAIAEGEKVYVYFMKNTQPFMN